MSAATSSSCGGSSAANDGREAGSPDETPDEIDGAPSSRPRKDGGSSSSGDGGPGGCDDDGVLPPSCDDVSVDVPGRPSCIRAICEHYRAHYKSRLATIAMECQKKETSAGGSCLDCGSKTLESACPDPTAAETCNRVAAVCADAGATTAAARLMGCEGAIAGLTVAGRISFLTCFTESSCSRTNTAADCAR